MGPVQKNQSTSDLGAEIALYSPALADLKLVEGHQPCPQVPTPIDWPAPAAHPPTPWWGFPNPSRAAGQGHSALGLRKGPPQMLH